MGFMVKGNRVAMLVKSGDIEVSNKTSKKTVSFIEDTHVASAEVRLSAISGAMKDGVKKAEGRVRTHSANQVITFNEEGKKERMYVSLDKSCLFSSQTDTGSSSLNIYMQIGNMVDGTGSYEGKRGESGESENVFVFPPPDNAAAMAAVSNQLLFELYVKKTCEKKDGP